MGRGKGRRYRDSDCRKTIEKRLDLRGKGYMDRVNFGVEGVMALGEGSLALGQGSLALGKVLESLFKLVHGDLTSMMFRHGKGAGRTS